MSKTAPSGEYLTTGSFLIYGKKNFLPPSTLEMGFAVMFRVTDECAQKHLGERRDRVTVDADGLESVYSEAFDRYGLEYPDSSSTVESGSDENSSVVVSAVGGDPKKLSKAALKAASKAPTMSSLPEAAQESDDEGAPINEEDEDEEGGEDEFDGVDDDKGENDAKQEKPRVGSTALAHEKGAKGAKGAKAIPPAVPDQNVTKRKAALSKKKQRRYAEQDDDDRAMAMLSLGHALPGDSRSAREKLSDASLSKKKQEVQQKQQRVGVRVGAAGAATSVLEQLSTATAPVRAKVESLLEAGLIKPHELDSYEVQALLALTESDALAVLGLFEEGLMQRKVGNKSGFLAGILKRFQRERKGAESVAEAGSTDRDLATGAAKPEANGEATSPSHDAKDGTQVKADEGDDSVQGKSLPKDDDADVDGDEDGDGDGDDEEDQMEPIDELDKITGCPYPDDELLYAVPVCGPYSSLTRYKFRVKLTPGTAKKGKCCKQAVEVFLSGRDASADEKYLIKGLTDPEMVAVMIGDVKLSTPGLQVIKQQASHRKQRGAKKKDK